MHVSERGLQLIESFEGFSSVRYLDSVGVPTIGYGTTAADVSPLPATCTRAQAEGWLRGNVARKYEPAVNALHVPLNPNQFDALVSFAYNLGPGIFTGTDIGNALRAREYGQAAADLLEYVHAGGQVLQGLVNRRAAERKLFLTPYVEPDPNHYLWFDATNRHLAKRTMNERETVGEYDQKRAHWLKWPGRLKRLRENSGLLAARLETVIEETHDRNSNHRDWRHKGLVARRDGKRVAG